MIQLKQILRISRCFSTKRIETQSLNITKLSYPNSLFPVHLVTTELTQQKKKCVQSIKLNPVNISDISIGYSKINHGWKIIDSPIINRVIETPKSVMEIGDYNQGNKVIELPSFEKSDDVGKQAARLIVIRRHKMRKHKLKKLRKKMKFEWAKVRQRREMRKEKAFQATLLSQIREAEKFSAEQYVAEKIQKATEVPISRLWKGRRLPLFIIKEKLGIK